MSGRWLTSAVAESADGCRSVRTEANTVDIVIPTFDFMAAVGRAWHLEGTRRPLCVHLVKTSMLHRRAAHNSPFRQQGPTVGRAWHPEGTRRLLCAQLVITSMFIAGARTIVLS